MVGVVLLPLRAQVLATPLDDGRVVASPGIPARTELHLSDAAASRIALGDDAEAPKAMKTSSDEAAEAEAAKNQPHKAAAKAGSTWDFIYDWPFWAIVGGVAVVAVGTVVIYKNSQPDNSCPALDTAGCYGKR